MAAVADTHATGTEAGNAAIVRAAFDARATQTGSVFDILWPDVLWTMPGTGLTAGTYEGRDAFVENASLPLVNRLSQPIACPTVG